jgi:hypothetical protein
MEQELRQKSVPRRDHSHEAAEGVAVVIVDEGYFSEMALAA